MSDEIDLSRRPDIERALCGALRDTINTHGPITRETAPSAAKRMIGQIKVLNRGKRNKAEADIAEATSRAERATERADKADAFAYGQRLAIEALWGYVSEGKPLSERNRRLVETVLAYEVTSEVYEDLAAARGARDRLLEALDQASCELEEAAKLCDRLDIEHGRADQSPLAIEMWQAYYAARAALENANG